MTKQSDFEISNPDAYKLVQYSNPEDEINLVHLWCLIKSSKKQLLIGLLLAWGIAVLWLFFVEPAYKSESRLLPPPEYLLSEISVKDDASRYKPTDIFNRYVKHFESVTNKQQFFNKNQLALHFQASNEESLKEKLIFQEQFQEPMQIVYDSKKGLPESAKVFFKLNDAELSAQWLNQYIEYIEQVTRDEMFDEINERLNARKKLLRNQINLKKLVGKQRRLDKIARFEEALTVAEKLGLKTASGISMAGNASVEVNTQDMPLYTRGSAALSAELAALKARKSDDPFILELRSLEEQLGRLEMYESDKSRVRTVLIDQRAEAEEIAENKNIPLIILLSSVLGLLMGFILIFAQRFLQRVREAESDMEVE